MCQTNGQVVDTVLTHAEACLERGEYKMVATALKSAIQQHGEILVADKTLLDRAVSLKAKLIEVRQGMTQPNYTPTDSNGRPPICKACKGTGKYRNAKYEALGKCVACWGKGFQTKEDFERQQRYWKRRREQAAANESQYAKALEDLL